MKTKDITLISLFAALIAVCAWISVPASVPFTMQLFAVYLSVGLLGGKRGTLAVIVYTLLGTVGLPVFSGFRGGVGALLNVTGGYIVGFSCAAAVMWLMEKLGGKKLLLPSMLLGMLVCYAFGTAWFMLVYTQSKGPIGLMSVLSLCVFPYIIPDLIKIALAYTLTLKLRTMQVIKGNIE